MAFIRSNAAPSWDQYKIFPYWVIEGSTGGEESATAIFESVASESRFERWHEDRQRLSLDKATLTYDAHRRIRAFRRLVRGMANPFLFRDIRECWIGKPGKFGDDMPPAKWEFLGYGDGAKVDFQLRLHDVEQGDEVIRNVYFPNHAYDEIVEDGVLKLKTERVRIKLGGTATSGGVENFNWGVNRINSGIVRLDAPPAGAVPVWGYCSFFVLVRCNQDIIKSRPINGGTYFELDGTEFVEPKGRK